MVHLPRWDLCRWWWAHFAPPFCPGCSPHLGRACWIAARERAQWLAAPWPSWWGRRKTAARWHFCSFLLRISHCIWSGHHWPPAAGDPGRGGAKKSGGCNFLCQGEDDSLEHLWGVPRTGRALHAHGCWDNGCLGTNGSRCAAATGACGRGKGERRQEPSPQPTPTRTLRHDSELASSCHSSAAHWIGLHHTGGFCCGCCCCEPSDLLRGWFA